MDIILDYSLDIILDIAHCQLTQLELSELTSELPSTIEIEATFTQAVTKNLSEISDFFLELEEKHPLWVEMCGAFVSEFFTGNSFLTLVEETSVLTLAPAPDTEPGLYEDAYLRIFPIDAPDTFFEVNIKAMVAHCKVEKLSF